MISKYDLSRFDPLWSYLLLYVVLTWFGSLWSWLAVNHALTAEMTVIQHVEIFALKTEHTEESSLVSSALGPS